MAKFELKIPEGITTKEQKKRYLYLAQRKNINDNNQRAAALKDTRAAAHVAFPALKRAYAELQEGKITKEAYLALADGYGVKAEREFYDYHRNVFKPKDTVIFAATVKELGEGWFQEEELQPSVIGAIKKEIKEKPTDDVEFEQVNLDNHFVEVKI